MSSSPNLDVSTFMDARKMSARQWLVRYDLDRFHSTRAGRRLGLAAT